MTRASRLESPAHEQPPNRAPSLAALVEAHGELVERVARRVLRRLPPSHDAVELGDLMNVGMLGLFEAAERFDSTAGHAFASFAEFRIKGAMLDELRRRDFFPRRLRLKANRLERARRKLVQTLGRQPEDAELAAAIGLGVERLRRLKDEIAPYHWIDVEDQPLAGVNDNGPFARVASAEVRQRLIDAIEDLPERERLVLDLYFFHELKLRQIGEVLDLTVGRISQIKTAALNTLQHKLDEAAFLN